MQQSSIKILHSCSPFLTQDCKTEDYEATAAHVIY